MKDKQTLFSDNQAITTTAVSTNFINLGTAATPPGAPAAIARDLGAAGLPLDIEVTTAFAGGTSIVVTVEVDDNSSFSSAKTVASSPTYATASLVAGKKLGLPTFPLGTDEQYVRLKYTVVGTMTAGKISAGVVTGIHNG